MNDKTLSKYNSLDVEAILESLNVYMHIDCVLGALEDIGLIPEPVKNDTVADHLFSALDTQLTKLIDNFQVYELADDTVGEIITKEVSKYLEEQQYRKFEVDEMYRIINNKLLIEVTKNN